MTKISPTTTTSMTTSVSSFLPGRLLLGLALMTSTMSPIPVLAATAASDAETNAAAARTQDKTKPTRSLRSSAASSSSNKNAAAADQPHRSLTDGDDYDYPMDPVPPARQDSSSNRMKLANDLHLQLPEGSKIQEYEVDDVESADGHTKKANLIDVSIPALPFIEILIDLEEELQFHFVRQKDHASTSIENNNNNNAAGMDHAKMQDFYLDMGNDGGNTRHRRRMGSGDYDYPLDPPKKQSNSMLHIHQERAEDKQYIKRKPKKSANTMDGMDMNMDMMDNNMEGGMMENNNNMDMDMAMNMNMEEEMMDNGSNMMEEMMEWGEPSANGLRSPRDSKSQSQENNNYNDVVTIGNSKDGWEIGPSNGFLTFQDRQTEKIPMGIATGAPDYSLFVAENGDVGLNTAAPEADLHIVGTTPYIRLEDDKGEDAREEQAWDITGSRSGFYVYEETSDGQRLPFQIQSGAPDHSFSVTKNGQVGIGTNAPQADFYVEGDAQISGNLQVGEHCYLDTTTCQWKSKNQRHRRQNNRFLSSFWDTDHDDDQDDDEDILEYEQLQQELNQVQEQSAQDKVVMEYLEATVKSLQEEQTQSLQRIQALEEQVAALVNLLQQQQQQQ